MNSYKFSLKQYKAISKAEIELNGITVLAGENGAGKSTITRWLYYLVEVIVKYEQFLYEDLRRDISSIMREYRMALRDTRMRSDSDTVMIPSIAKWNSMAHSIDCSNEENVARVVREAKDLVVRFADYIQNNIGENGRITNRLARMMMYLNIDDNTTFDREKFIDDDFKRISLLYADYQIKLQKRSKQEMFEFIRQHYDSSIKNPSSIQLTEDRVAILEKLSVGHILGLQRAIYIDTPMALGNDTIDNQLWDNLLDLLKRQDNINLHVSLRKMLLRVQRIIHGTVQMAEEDFDSNLHYVREDNLDIPIVEAATGVKSFAYIIRLLENGYLDKNTLLIIDEPEAHLHPQWIVEYARILVLLKKEIGVRILIASHNPDMVAAIQSIGKKEGIGDAITFYQAFSSPEHPFEYEYKNLGIEISEIFKSFNIAISRIQDYGRTDNQ